MPNGRGKNKGKHRRRPKKTSAGINGATKHPLSEVEKGLLGKGRVQFMQHVPCERNWFGVNGTFVQPWNPEQAKENERLYPHLFR